MLNTFIADLKKSPYYNKWIFNDNILCLYVGGSISANTSDENSDFDLIAITLSGNSFDASHEVYLKYKGKKVHWYYWPVKEVFKLYNDSVWLAGSIYFKNIRPELIIYIKPGYQKLWELLIEYRESISKLACYQLFELMKKEIEQVLSNKDILAISPNKGIYHLCLATSYLTNEQYNLDLLRDLKPICRRPPSQSSNEAAVEIISKGLAYVKSFPINSVLELEKIYSDFCARAILLKLKGVEL